MSVFVCCIPLKIITSLITLANAVVVAARLYGGIQTKLPEKLAQPCRCCWSCEQQPFVHLLVTHAFFIKSVRLIHQECLSAERIPRRTRTHKTGSHCCGAVLCHTSRERLMMHWSLNMMTDVPCATAKQTLLIQIFQLFGQMLEYDETITANTNQMIMNSVCGWQVCLNYYLKRCYLIFLFTGSNLWICTTLWFESFRNLKRTNLNWRALHIFTMAAWYNLSPPFLVYMVDVYLYYI